MLAPKDSSHSCSTWETVRALHEKNWLLQRHLEEDRRLQRLQRLQEEETVRHLDALIVAFQGGWKSTLKTHNIGRE